MITKIKHFLRYIFYRSIYFFVASAHEISLFVFTTSGGMSRKLKVIRLKLDNEISQELTGQELSSKNNDNK